MTATGAEAGENLVPVGPARPTGDFAEAGPMKARADNVPADDVAADDVLAHDVSAEDALADDAVRPADRSPRRLYRGIVAAVLGVLAGCGAWLLLRHGIRTDAFPPFLAGTTSTPITRYSGPWLTAAAGAALLAALLLMSAAFDIVRWSRSTSGSGGSGSGSGTGTGNPSRIVPVNGAGSTR